MHKHSPWWITLGTTGNSDCEERKTQPRPSLHSPPNEAVQSGATPSSEQGQLELQNLQAPFSKKAMGPSQALPELQTTQSTLPIRANSERSLLPEGSMTHRVGEKPGRVKSVVLTSNSLSCSVLWFPLQLKWGDNPIKKSCAQSSPGRWD